MERQEATNLSNIRPDHQIRYKLASEIIKTKSLNKLVVDAGCGSGRFSSAIAKLGAKKIYGAVIRRIDSGNLKKK